MDLSVCDQLITIRDWVRWGASRFREAGLFFGHGTDNAFDEALALVLHALHLEHEQGLAYLDARLTREEREKVLGYFTRRVEERIPAAYITHEAWFAGLSFYVNENVLVPRSPIAELIEQGFEPWLAAEDSDEATKLVGAEGDPCSGKRRESIPGGSTSASLPPRFPEQGSPSALAGSSSGSTRILDLCTGSGCIAIATAHYLPHARVDASDISPSALEVAQVNLDRYQLQERVRLYRSDLFDDLPPAQYDLIVSNPPYVSSEEMAALPEEYGHEPALGLEAGSDGLEIVSRILAQGARWLRPGGIMVVEVGESMENLVRRYPRVPFLWLDFERGGGGVFLLTREQLLEHQNEFEE